VDVVKLISTFSSSHFATALVQTLAVAVKMGGYRGESERDLIFNALRTSHLIDDYEKNKSRLNSKNINRWQVSGQTLLTRAVQAGDQMLVNALVKCGASFHLPDQHGNNALHAAVKAHEWSVCSHLLELGANPNTSDRSGVSTLTYLAQAFAEGDQDTAIRVATLIAPLLAKGYRLDRVVYFSEDSEIRWGKTTILAILQSDLNRYGSYLDVLHADDVNLADNHGNTPLMFAAKHGLLTVLQALMNKGADVNIAEINGWTPLMIAAEKGLLAITQALLSAPAIDINAIKPDGVTALIIAASNGKDDVVKALINKGANVNLADNNGWTPLMFAAEKGHLTTIQALLSAPGINIDAKKSDGGTALYLAASNGKDDVVKALIKQSADVDITDNHGQTPMMVANSLGYLTIVQAFFDRY
jgi:ankyrin repeat protein